MPTLAASDIVTAHATLADSADRIAGRRLVYALLAELLTGAATPDDPDVLDSPVVRGAIGAAAAGAGGLHMDELVPVSALTGNGWQASVGGVAMSVASTRAARSALAPALARVAGEMSAAGATGCGLSVLTDADGRLTAAVGLVERGAALAEDAVGALVPDLAGHVGLLAVVAGAGRLGSASVREFPGLVVLPEPVTELEAAEALVHESAHQLIFDLAVTHDLLPVESRRCEHFMPPWHRPGIAWPLEQTFAAWHAYSCLSVLAAGIPAASRRSAAPSSLLPHATERADALGDWLDARAANLGTDARRLLALFRTGVDHGVPTRARVTPPEGAQIQRRHAGRVLVGLRGPRPELYWTS